MNTTYREKHPFFGGCFSRYAKNGVIFKSKFTVINKENQQYKLILKQMIINELIISKSNNWVKF